jgi:hypothetical protein
MIGTLDGPDLIVVPESPAALAKKDLKTDVMDGIY